jgi:RNA polymerase sigma factor (sigma-70 family)
MEAIDPVDHIGLAMTIAAGLTTERPIEDTEAFGDAMIGLIVAAEHFDPSLGYQFSTYAWRAIRRTIIEGHRRRNRHLKCKRATRVLFVDPEHLKEKQGSGDPLEPIDTEDLIATMISKINSLPTQYARVILARLDGKKLHEIGEDIGLTRERVRQIQISATGMLRQMMASEGAIG